MDLFLKLAFQLSQPLLTFQNRFPTSSSVCGDRSSPLRLEKHFGKRLFFLSSDTTLKHVCYTFIHDTVTASAQSESPILPGDLIVYRSTSHHTSQTNTQITSKIPWTLGAVTHVHNQNIEVAPVFSREKDEQGRLQVFIDWACYQRHVKSFSLQENVDVIPLETDYETRVIEDRIINPHGEESEDCWLVDPALLNTWSINLFKQDEET